MNLKDLLEERIKYQIELEKSNQIGTLSGSNALLFDGYNFISEDSDHCPRIALLRRVGDIQEDRDVENFISNNHGRTFEDFLKKILEIHIKDIENIEFREEEEVEVKFEDDKGNRLLTARPDKIIKYDNEISPVEIKTIQSNSTAYNVFIKGKPKLNALIQLAIYLYGHKLNKGYLLYCASNWFSGFAGKGNRWKVNPSFKIFEITISSNDGYIYYDNKKSIIDFNRIIQGSYKFLEHKDNKTIPPRPQWQNSEGEEAQYIGCNYCFASESCDFVDSLHNTNLIEFFHKVKELNNGKR